MGSPVDPAGGVVEAGGAEELDGEGGPQGRHRLRARPSDRSSDSDPTASPSRATAADRPGYSTARTDRGVAPRVEQQEFVRISRFLGILRDVSI